MEPQLRRAYLVGGVLGLAAGVTVLAASILLFPGLILDLIGPRQEEERPPVVVSNGSIVVDVPDFSKDEPPTAIPANKKGRLDNDGAAKKQRQKGDNPGYDKSVDYADLWIGGASDTAECAALKKTPVRTLVDAAQDKIRIDTANGVITIAREPRPGSGKFDLTFDFPLNVDRKSKHRVELGSPHKLVSVTFNGKTCQLNEPDPWVQIWAR